MSVTPEQLEMVCAGLAPYSCIEIDRKTCVVTITTRLSFSDLETAENAADMLWERTSDLRDVAAGLWRENRDPKEQIKRHHEGVKEAP